MICDPISEVGLKAVKAVLAIIKTHPKKPILFLTE